MNQLINDLTEALKQYKDSKRIEFAKTSYPTNMKVLGVTVPNIKLVLKELKTITKTYQPTQKKKLAKDLINTNIFELQQLAYEYIGNDKKVLKTLSEEDINDLGKNLDNWLSVDYYAALFVGYAWREGIISTAKIKDYLKSDNFWIRRIAIVATVALNQKARGGSGDSKRTIEICEMVVHDHQDMIIKALSWALRELAKVDKEPVFAFIETHKNKLHKKVLREVSNKLEKGVKY